jgi:hypothetical protein
MTGQGHVHNAITAEGPQRTVSGTPGQSLISEVVITQDGAWFTDTLHAKLYLVPISPTGLTGGFSVLALTGPAANTNGVEPERYGSHTRRTHPDRRTFDHQPLSTVDSVTGASAFLVSVFGPDGLLYEAGRLRVAQPFQNEVSRPPSEPGPDRKGRRQGHHPATCSAYRRPSRPTVVDSRGAEVAARAAGSRIAFGGSRPSSKNISSSQRPQSSVDQGRRLRACGRPRPTDLPRPERCPRFSFRQVPGATG